MEKRRRIELERFGMSTDKEQKRDLRREAEEREELFHQAINDMIDDNNDEKLSDSEKNEYGYFPPRSVEQARLAAFRLAGHDDLKTIDLGVISEKTFRELGD